MTNNLNKSLLEIIDDFEHVKAINENGICDDLMYILSRLDIGHDRVVRYWMANDLYILLKYGSTRLEEHRRNDRNWWG
jgi:hypothetical protein